MAYVMHVASNVQRIFFVGSVMHRATVKRSLASMHAHSTHQRYTACYLHCLRRAGLTILTWSTPLNFIGKSVILLHLLAGATSVARLGAIARPDQQTGVIRCCIRLGGALSVCA